MLVIHQITVFLHVKIKINIYLIQNVMIIVQKEQY